MKNSNQRITKIKKDPLEALLRKAEGMNVEDACSIQPTGSDLTPYPEMNKLRNWMHNYLLSGITKIYPTRFDQDGETYFTGLIDGLPIFTKFAKTIDVEGFDEIPNRVADFLTKIGSPTINEQFVVSDFSSSNYFTLPDTSVYKNRNAYFLKFTTSDDTVTEQPLIVARNYLHVRTVNDKLQIKNNWTSDTFTDILEVETETSYNIRIKVISTTQIIVGVLNNAGSYTDLVSLIYTDPLNFDTDDGFYIGSDTDTLGYDGSIDFSECKIVSPIGEVKTFLHYNKESTGYTQKLTSKPGLWLSNLIQPYTESQSGSYIRQNFIHDGESYYEEYNSNIVGNYSYSFLQSLQAYREDGSTHDDKDSFALHWSPNDLSCMSFESIVIPSANQNSTTTYYLTLAQPTDPDMQIYDESSDKNDLSFYSIDNNDDIPATTTLYNCNAIAGGYVFNLQVNTIVNPDDPDPDPYGLCVTGTITYTDSSLGTTCTQNINSCFQSVQSYFDPVKPAIPTAKPIEVGGSFSYTFYSQGCCGKPTAYNAQEFFDLQTENPHPNGSYVAVTNVTNTATYEYRQDGRGRTSPITCTLTLERCGVGGGMNLSTGGYYPEAVVTCGNSTGSSSCGANYGNITILFTPNTDAQEGINLYLNIYDLKCQYEQQGLPWTGGCGTARFSIEVSTESCNESCCKSILLAKNADISALGNISNLISQILSNSF